MKIYVDDVQFRSAGREDRRSGLLGWATFRLNDDLEVNGVAVRRTLGGRMTISFPARWDRSGCKHFVLRPLTDRARLDIEQQLLEALGMLDADEVA